jgi:hypothetical protein
MKKTVLFVLTLFTFALVYAEGQQPRGAKTYNIGDTGPAGGIIFYNKGSFSDGWQYLEAAPAEYEFRAEFGDEFYKGGMPLFDWEIGTGKSNTRELVRQAQRRGIKTGVNHLNQAYCAAVACTGLNINGYNDWFLPSEDELKLMYSNLFQKGLGGFAAVYYWSSTGVGEVIDFLRNGRRWELPKGYPTNTRAIRSF